MEAAKASREMHMANLAVEDAKLEQITVRETASIRRKERLQNIIKPDKNPSVQNARIANVERLKLEQSKLARFLQLEERTRKLCDKLVDMKKVEAARQG